MTKDELIKYYFGYEHLKEEQNKVIESVLAYKDTIAIMPTGFGKSITFQIPAIMLDGLCLVVTPLIALMVDQVRVLIEKYPYTGFLCSIQSYEEQRIIYSKIKSGKIKILYISGERLQSNLFKKNIENIKISLLVFDEVHTLLWGETFRYELRKVNKFIEFINYKPVMLALTATATVSCINKIKNILALENPNIIKINCDRNNIYYNVIKTNKKDKVLINIIKNNRDVKGIIYCLTIQECNKVFKLLKANKINVSMYYGSLSKEDKKNNQDSFTRGINKVMICTNAFGMGIDIPDIRYVIEYNLPSSLEDFVQQVGRCSRDGRYAEAIILFNIKDIEINRFFIEQISNNYLSEKEVNIIKKEHFYRLDSMIKFCLTKKCLHRYINKYFGNKQIEKCNMCSNCKKNSP
ncbi:MAG: RecQ family ATP-dependent DNA helicase [Anaeroplasma sp.]